MLPTMCDLLGLDIGDDMITLVEICMPMSEAIIEICELVDVKGNNDEGNIVEGVTSLGETVSVG